MVNAHFFVRSGGGYSDIISRIIRSRGHEVITKYSARTQTRRHPKYECNPQLAKN